MEIIVAILQALLLVLLAPLFSGTSRWLRAKMHTRRGPSIFQDYYDIAKLFKRQDVHPSFLRMFLSYPLCRNKP